MRRRPVIALSGGFDPLHVGHVRMIEGAQAYGDVIIILNSDDWLERKKGFTFMTWEQRCEILDALESVYLVIGVNDKDNTVCSALDHLRPDYFGNGGDRTEGNTPERYLCQDLGIEEIYNLGGGKIQSSRSLVWQAADAVADDEVEGAEEVKGVISVPAVSAEPNWVDGMRFCITSSMSYADENVTIFPKE